MTWGDFGTTPLRLSWQMLRAIRSSPPGLASQEDRRAVFVAALEQSEQLFKAAAGVGVETRPILAFYGLSQAGRAIAAAGGDDEKWRLETHGITTGALADAAKGLAAVTVRDSRSGKHAGSFPAVSQVLGSASLPGSTPLGTLWHLLPETWRFTLPGASSNPVLEVPDVGPYAGLGRGVLLEVTGLPRDLASPSKPGGGRADGWREERDRTAAFLEDYPSLSGYRFHTPEGGPCLQPAGSGCVVTLLYDRGEDLDPSTVRDARTVAYRGSQYVFPAVGGSDRPAHPLTLWWAILFALSMLARYEPEQWTLITDVNRSKDAAAVEFLLDEALVALPETIHRCLMRLDSPA